MARSRTKIACSIDSQLLARVERLRESTGESRSAVISRALSKLTADELRKTRVQEYLQAYRDMPETDEEIEEARRSARARLTQLPWQEP